MQERERGNIRAWLMHNFQQRFVDKRFKVSVTSTSLSSEKWKKIPKNHLISFFSLSLLPRQVSNSRVRWRELNEQTTANRYQIAFFCSLSLSSFNDHYHHHESLWLNPTTRKKKTSKTIIETNLHLVLYFDLHCFRRVSFTFKHKRKNWW